MCSEHSQNRVKAWLQNPTFENLKGQWTLTERRRDRPIIDIWLKHWEISDFSIYDSLISKISSHVIIIIQKFGSIAKILFSMSKTFLSFYWMTLCINCIVFASFSGFFQRCVWNSKDNVQMKIWFSSLHKYYSNLHKLQMKTTLLWQNNDVHQR